MIIVLTIYTQIVLNISGDSQMVQAHLSWYLFIGHNQISTCYEFIGKLSLPFAKFFSEANVGIRGPAPIGQDVHSLGMLPPLFSFTYANYLFSICPYTPLSIRWL